MSARGRGSVLRSEGDSKSSESSVKDSGLGSRSPTGEYRRVGRGRLLDDLTSSFTNISLSTGRGRAHLAESIGMSDDLLDKSSHDISLKSGRGRAQLFKNLILFDQDEDSTKSIQLPSPVEEEKKEEEEQKVPCSFFKPSTCHGNKGIPTPLACNYIRLSADPNKGVFEYEVRFKPNVDSIQLRNKYLNEHREELGKTKTFDGVVLYLPILLKEKLTTFVSKDITDSTGPNIEIRILYKKKRALKNCLHLYNVLFDRVMKTLNYVRFDRKQFDPKSPIIIPHSKLEIWPGYVTSVDEYEGGLMLCCDVSHRLLCQKTVLETLTEIFKADPSRFQDNAKKSLLGSVVITHYNKRTYRIDDIAFDKNPLSTFKVKENDVSYVDYYRSNHNIEIFDKKQPLLISIKKQKSAQQNQAEDFVFCLIPEICHLTGLRDEIRKDGKLLREIATFTRVSPNQRLLALEKFYNNIQNCPEARDILLSWGLSLSSRYENITGRLFEAEQVIFAKKSFSAGPDADFSKYACINELLDVVNLNNWLLIHCKNDTNAAKEFCKNMDQCTRTLGINMQYPKIITLNSDRDELYVQALRNNIDPRTQIVVCICPTSRDDRYATIKKICCAEIPIPSQVINAHTLLHKKGRSIVQKIALQINCKLGGSLWTVKIPFKNVMICGIDSYHDAAQKGNSVAAFVSSLNGLYTKWYSKAVIQSKREEIVNGLCTSFTAALKAYEKENDRLPDSVIIYRDGVGDGQLQVCSEYEIPQFESACKNVFPDYVLKITFIVVQKRINTRYFVIRNSNAENPKPGTIVDHSITRDNLFDFFLVSQSVRQGTVSPSHYIVLRDDANYNPDIIQRLTYKLCFLYYNWPGTIRIPACCQYAHKMAYLIGQSIRRSTSEDLATKLFYL